MGMQKPKQATCKCPNFRVEYYEEITLFWDAI
jgi:hypothetical protein